MNRGLKHYTKQLTQEVGGASCSVNLNKEDANLHISIPLIKTVGLDPIDLSIFFNLQDFNNDSNNYLFGKGSKLNLFTRYTDTTSKITLLNADGSSDEYLSTKNFYNAETQLTINKVQYTSSQYIYQVKDKYGNQRDFYNGINYPKQIKMKSGAIITTDFQTTQPYLSNGRGDKVQFTVVNGLTTKLTYLHDNVEVYRTEIEYSNNRIYKVKYYNGETLMSSLCLSYGGYGFELIDEISGYRIKYIFSGSRVLNIIPGYDSSYSNSPSTSISYEDNKTTVTNYKGEKLYYYFDSCQLPLFEMDDKGNVIETEYDSETKVLLAKSNSVNVRNTSQNIFPSTNVSYFTSENVTLTSVAVTDTIFSNILGNTIYKARGTTTGTNRLTFRLNRKGISTDNITAVLFGKQLTNFSESNYVKVMLRVGSYDEDSDVDYFKKNNIDNQFDLMTLGVSATHSYDFIDLNVIIYGNTEIELGGIQVLLKEFGDFYQYDDKGNAIELGSNGTENFSYNISNEISSAISKDSTMNNFNYDDKGNLIKYSTSYGTRVENIYDETYCNNLICTKTISANSGKIIETRKEYTDDGRFVSKEIDELGNITNFDQYDELGRIRKLIDALDNIREFDYFSDGTLKEIILRGLNDSISSNYTYDSKKRLSTITLDNGTVYSFIYDERDNLTEIKLNNVVIFKYTYDLETGNITSQKNGINGDGYSFEYKDDTSSLVENIYYVSSDGTRELKYKYVYDGQDRLIRVIDSYDDILYAYDYDNNNRLSMITGEYIQIKNKYDNLGNCVAKSTKVNNKNIFTSYDSTARSKGMHPASLKEAISGFIGSFDKDSRVYNGEEFYESIDHNSSVVNLPVSKEGRINCLNVNSNNLLSYRIVNPAALPESGCIQFWFKPDALSVGPDYMECLFSSKNPNGSGKIELVAEGGRINLIIVDDYGNEHHLLSTNTGINYGEWNFISLNFTIEGADYRNMIECHMLLNKDSQTYKNSTSGFNISLGSSPVYNIGHDFNGISPSHIFEGKIAALRIMPRTYSLVNEIYQYYQLSKMYVLENELDDIDNKAVEFSQTNLFTTNMNIHDLFEICPLQNTVESLKGLKPIKFELRNNTNKMDKNRIFNFNNKIKRYAYIADGAELVYNFGQSTDGTIAMRIYFDELTNLQYIFQAKDSEGHTLGLFRNSIGKVFIDVNGNDVSTDFIVDSNEWVNVALSFSETIVSDSETESNELNLRLVINEQYYSITIPKDFSYSLLDVAIGRMKDTYNETTSFGIYRNCYPLYGQLEMLCSAQSYLERSTILDLFDEICGITKVQEFDELGFLKKVDLHKIGNTILSNTFEYKARTSSPNYISKLIEKEKINLNGTLLTDRKYYYDNLGRVTHVEDNVFGDHIYQYDYRGFLVSADNIEYAYDKNGNITKAGNKEFVYDEQIKDKLKKVNGQEIVYDLNNPGLIKSFNGTNYTYEGRRLKTLTNPNGLYTYVYDDKGLRTSKYKTGEYWIYQYDGDRLSYQLHNNIRLDFLYDEDDKLYGFVKNNSQKYFYIRDMLENILGIIDSDGNLVVKYDYDSYGTIKSISGELASTIGQENPFRYKGYYYDLESNLYYCKSRYYVPEWGRWLTYDNPCFLEIEKLDGLNLYCYCKNNPISCVDPSGNMPKWVGWVIGAAIVVGLAVATVATAGGVVPALAAVMSAAAGVASSTAAVSVLSFAFLASATVYTGALVYNAANIATAELRGSSYETAFQDAINMGESVAVATATAGLTGGFGGYLSYVDQVQGLPHSWSTERKQFIKNNPEYKNGYVLHHPYGRHGANIKYYYPVTVEEHKLIHQQLGYGRGQGGFWQYREWINWWNTISKLF